MMKTPDEIKKGLECCADNLFCIACPYKAKGFPECVTALLKDAHACFQRFETELGAAVSDLKTISNTTYDACLACVFSPGEGRNCPRCEEINCFAWRGVCADNSGKEAKQHG